MNVLLEAKQLSKHYGKLKAVSDLSFQIKKGNIYGILGPNGSGKSTTLGMVLNVINQSTGTYEWFDGVNTHQALKRVGAIIERPNFYPYLSAKKNLELVCKIKEVSSDHIEEKLKLVGLWERKDSKFSTFSLGMKQRLAIASALLNNPEVLILDEPTNGLDPEGIHQIRELIKSIAKEGTTILLASHLLDEVEKVCTDVIVLRKGVLIFSGKVDQMINNLGYFKLQSSNLSLLESELLNIDSLEKIRIEGAFVFADLCGRISAQELNTHLFNKGIVLSTLSKQQLSLEEQFLRLTQKLNDE